MSQGSFSGSIQDEVLTIFSDAAFDVAVEQFTTPRSRSRDV